MFRLTVDSYFKFTFKCKCFERKNIFHCHNLHILFVSMFMKQRYLGLKVSGVLQDSVNIALWAAAC